MRKKVIKKYHQLNQELIDIYNKVESLDENKDLYLLSNLRREAVEKNAQIILLEELIGPKHVYLKEE